MSSPEQTVMVEAVKEVFARNPKWIDADIAGMGVKQTALHTSCKHGHAKVVEWLLQNNANPNESTVSKNTALHYACRYVLIT